MSPPESLQLDRRRFLQGVALGALLPGCASSTRGEASPLVGRYWLSACGADPSTYGLAALGEEGDARLVKTDFRGHDVTMHPRWPGVVVLFGRRPAATSAIVDLSSQEVVTLVAAHAGCAFQGHGFFTSDGEQLITVEADTQSGQGKLVLRDPDSFSVQRVIDTWGIGPHEVQLMPDGATVVVASGGLLTRPETGREVLNLATMDSSLSYVDLESGELVEQWRVASSKSSIRHLDVAPDGTVAFGVQVQREALDHGELVPLAGVHRQGQEPQLFEDGRELMGELKDYVGSVAVSARTRVAGFTSPRGNAAMFWNIDGGELVGVHELADCCGLAVSTDGEHFILSSSLGEVRVLSVVDLAEDLEARQRIAGMQLDNHLIEVTLGSERS